MGRRGILVLYQESWTFAQRGRAGSGLRGAEPGDRGPTEKKAAGPGSNGALWATLLCHSLA